MAGRKSETALNDEFKTEEVSLRGQAYKFREISGSQYEECVKLAEGPDGTADLSTVLRLMIPLSLVEPKWDAEKIYSKPLPVLTAIQNLVNRMHFRSEEPDQATDEEEAAPNELEPSTS